MAATKKPKRTHFGTTLSFKPASNVTYYYPTSKWQQNITTCTTTETKRHFNKTMKKSTLLLLLALLTVGYQRTVAQSLSQIDWSYQAETLQDILTTDESNPKYIVLYNKTAADSAYTTTPFLTLGGGYGMEGVLSFNGMRFFITKCADKDAYQLHSNVSNATGTSASGAKDCMSIVISSTARQLNFDRSRTATTTDDGNGSRPDWTLKYNTTNKTYSFYNFNTDGAKVYYDKDAGVTKVTKDSTSAQPANEWFFVSEESYHNTLRTLAMNSYVEVTSLLYDPGFNRFNNDQKSWVASPAQADITSTMNVNSSLVSNTKMNAHHEYNYYNLQIGADSLDLGKTDNTDWQTSYWLFFDYYGKDYCAGIWTAGSYMNQVDSLPAGHYRITVTAMNTGSDTGTGAFIVNNRKYLIPLANTTNYKAWQDSIYSEAKKYLKAGGDATDYQIQGVDIIAAAKTLEADENTYTIEAYVTIREEDVANKTNSISYGFANYNADGTYTPVFADNFRLYYSNATYVAYLSANSTSTTVDHYAYKRPVDLYLRRTFTAGAWNDIALPFDITKESLKYNFGDNVRLSALKGINPDRPTQLMFETTDTLKANTIGLIYVPEGAEPFFAYSEENKLKVETLYKPITSSTSLETISKEIHGPIWQIRDLQRFGNESGEKEGYVADENSCKELTVTMTNSKNEQIKGHAYYYKPKQDNASVKWPAQSYIIDNGAMYYLSSDWGVQYGTRWYLQNVTAAANAKRLTLAIDGIEDDEPTVISDITTPERTATGIYNLQGQRLADDSQLTPGIYIINGHKILVK